MTDIINIFGAPGSGKSTTATGVFSKLKLNGVNAEYVSEIAKDFTWENRSMALSCQPYVFGKQYRDMFRLLGQVDVIITDSPILLSYYYAKKYPNENIPLNSFCSYVLEQHKILGGINYLLRRDKVYNPIGRNQTELESMNIDAEQTEMLQNLDIKYISLFGNEGAIDYIAKTYLNKGSV